MLNMYILESKSNLRLCKFREDTMFVPLNYYKGNYDDTIGKCFRIWSDPAKKLCLLVAFLSTACNKMPFVAVLWHLYMKTGGKFT